MKVNRGSDLLDSGSMGALHDFLLGLLGLDNLAVRDGPLGLFSRGSFSLLFYGFLGNGLLSLGDLRLGGSCSRSLSGRRGLCGLGGIRLSWKIPKQ